MSDGLKQRVAGALVLGALGLIFLPFIFDFVDPHQIDTTSKLPPMPQIKAIDIQQATPPKGAEPEQSSALEMAQPPEKARTEAVSLDENNLPKSWYVQIASFPEKSKAEELKQKLGSAGFESHITAAKVDSKLYYRVAAGPKIDKRKARLLKAQIDKQFGTDAILTQYQP